MYKTVLYQLTNTYCNRFIQRLTRNRYLKLENGGYLHYKIIYSCILKKSWFIPLKNYSCLELFHNYSFSYFSQLFQVLGVHQRIKEQKVLPFGCLHSTRRHTIKLSSWKGVAFCQMIFSISWYDNDIFFYSLLIWWMVLIFFVF